MKGTQIFSLSLLMLLSPTGPLTAQEVDDDLNEQLNEKTVMITVNFSRGKAAEYGTGVLLCQEDDRAWILTANHVFAGKSTEPWKQVRLRQIERATIAFYRNSPPAVEADTAVLRKQIKSCRDSVQQAEDAGRRDIADRERAEIEIIASYLPELLSGEALLERVRAVAAEIGYSGPQDKGRFMKEWMSRFRGQAEGRDVQSALAGLDTA